MSRFANKAVNVNKIENHAGGEAFTMTPELELYSLVCNSILSDKYYESAECGLSRLEALVRNVDAQFVANLASYARNEMNLRSIPIVLVGLLCKLHGKNVARKAVSRVVKRADEINELMGYAFSINENAVKQTNGQVKGATKLPKSLVKGLKDVFESGRFNEYHFAKYNRKTNPKFRDVLFLTHAKPQNEDMEKLFKDIAEDTLETPYTWEVEISACGKDEAKKTAKWEELVASGKLGYMALMRNLHNILSAGVSDETIAKVCEVLSDEDKAVRAKQFPFRFWSAYKRLIDIPSRGWRYYGDESNTAQNYNKFQLNKVVKALEAAVKHSIRSYPDFKGNTLVAGDVSGSMWDKISPKSEIYQVEIGLVMGSLLTATNDDAIMGFFGDTFKVIDNVHGSVLDNTKEMLSREGEVGYSTNGYKVVQYLNKTKTKVNNVILFTDCQLWNSGGYRNDNESLRKEWLKYKYTNPEARLFLFDLAGYGNTPLEINDQDVIMVSGWSDRIFEAVNYIMDSGSIVELISKYDG